MPTQNEALLEAYASCPPSARIYYTVEIWQSSFAQPARAVANVGDDIVQQREGQPSQLFAVGKNLFYFCLGRDQFFTFRGPDRQLYLFAAAAGRNRRGNAISVFRVGFHGVVEQYRVAAFQRYAQRRGRFDTEELKIHAGRLGREIDQDVLRSEER